jgi:hypothetical protein
MNIKLHYKLNFCAGVFFNNTIFLNNYEVELDLVTTSTNGHEQNVALDRVKYFVEHVCRDAFFVNESETQQINALTAANINVLALPEEPIDQIVGIMLFHKLNAVMEDRMTVYRLAINSELGDYVSYIHAVDESSGPFEELGWWNNPEMSCNLLESRVKENTKIVKINLSDSWNDIGLGWEPDQAPDETNDVDSVVFVNFKKDVTE